MVTANLSSQVSNESLSSSSIQSTSSLTPPTISYTALNPFTNQLYVYSTTRNVTVAWSIEHDYLVNYTILDNSSVVFQKNNFLYSLIIFTSPMLSIGTHNITILAIDSNSNSCTNSVTVNVIAPSSNHTLSPPTINGINNSYFNISYEGMSFDFKYSESCLNYSINYIATILNLDTLSTITNNIPNDSLRNQLFYPSGDLSAGDYSLTIAAYDTQGLESKSVLFFSISNNFLYTSTTSNPVSSSTVFYTSSAISSNADQLTPGIVLGMLAGVTVLSVAYAIFNKRKVHDVNGKKLNNKALVSKPKEKSSMQIIFCMNCNAEAFLDDKYCQNCGKPLY